MAYLAGYQKEEREEKKIPVKKEHKTANIFNFLFHHIFAFVKG